MKALGRTRNELYQQPLRKNDEAETPPLTPQKAEAAAWFSLPWLYLLAGLGLCRYLPPGFDYLKEGGNFGPTWPEVTAYGSRQSIAP